MSLLFVSNLFVYNSLREVSGNLETLPAKS